MKTKHYDNCEAPICCDDLSTQQGVVWQAGEAICTRSPRQKLQKVQKRINDAFLVGKFQEPTGWTAKQLIESSM